MIANKLNVIKLLKKDNFDLVGKYNKLVKDIKDYYGE